MASREILLRFATTNLKKAQTALKEIRKATKESIKGIKDVDKRKQAKAEAKTQDIEDRRILGEARDRQRGEARSRRARRRSRAGLKGPRGVSGGEAVEKARAFFGGGGLGSIGVAASVAGPIAAAASVVWDAFARPYVEAEFRAIERAELAPLKARLAELEARDLERRIAEDQSLQDELGRQAVAQDRAIQSALRGKRILKTSRLDRLGGIG